MIFGVLLFQLTVDHNTSNEDELRRLKSIGLDPDQLRRVGRLGTQQNTRCIGDFNIKSGYSDHDILRYCEYINHDFCIP